MEPDSSLYRSESSGFWHTFAGESELLDGIPKSSGVQNLSREGWDEDSTLTP